MSRFTAFTSNEPLTLEQIARIAPSAFATHPHESRSAKYVYIPTRDVITAMIKEGFQPFSVRQSNSRIEGKTEFTKHMIRFRHQSLTPTDVSPEAVVINSHDGTSAYNVLSGGHVYICSNGLVMVSDLIDSIKVMHKGNVISDVIEGSYRVIDNSKKALEVAGTWKHLQLTSGDQNAFAEAAHVLRFADSEGNVDTPITASQLLQPRRWADSDSSLWSTFNRVQENVIRGGLSARRPDSVNASGQFVRGRRVSTREVTNIDGDVRLNKALWVLAERMATLKAA